MIRILLTIIVAVGFISACGGEGPESKPTETLSPSPSRSAERTTVAPGSGGPTVPGSGATVRRLPVTPTAPAVKGGQTEAGALQLDYSPKRIAKPLPEPSPKLFYKNCEVAKDNGAAPLYRGQSAGYRAGLDEDGDGVACEK